MTRCRLISMMARLTIISDPLNDISDPLLAVSTPEDVLSLGFISEPDDNDFYSVTATPGGRTGFSIYVQPCR